MMAGQDSADRTAAAACRIYKDQPRVRLLAMREELARQHLSSCFSKLRFSQVP